MDIVIDDNSGYCFGVEYAIRMAEDELEESQELYCLGDIVHNRMEVERLNQIGLKIIDKEQLKLLKDCKVLIRAHGEPPETYQIAIENNINLIDASCPVVLKLQNRIKYEFDKVAAVGGNVVIYGQKGHAEVIGLAGQTNNKAIIVSKEEDLDQVDFTKPLALFSQTTKSTDGYYALKDKIVSKINGEDLPADINLDFNDSICRQVSNREPQLKIFSAKYETIIFVSGKKSSNGMALYQVCKATNDNTYFVENDEELDYEKIIHSKSIGICGATSTPMWLMQKVKDAITSHTINN